MTLALLAPLLTHGNPDPETGPASLSFRRFDERARAGERLTVAFFGGSLTWSANASDPNRTGFRGRMAEYFTAKYPEARFTFVDAAIGGTGSNLGVFRLDRDVLSRKPDLVFLDFACNDGGENRDLLATCCYESLLRRLIGAGIPVQQMFFTFRFWAEHGAPYDAPDCHPRLIDYRRLAEEYGTAVGDVYTDALIPALDAGEIDPDRAKAFDALWPFDGAHPGDLGYRYFSLAAIAGYERAVAEGRLCRLPETPVFGTVENVRRLDAASLPLSPPWTLGDTYRTSAWFDGLSSRWMDRVAVFTGPDATPIAFDATANLVGLFGEGDPDALSFDLAADGAVLGRFSANPGAGGRLFYWRPAPLEGWEKGEAAARHFTVTPIPSSDGKGELRVGALCTATVVPVRGP